MSQHRQERKFSRYRNHQDRAKLGLLEGNNLCSHELCDGPGAVQHLNTALRETFPLCFLGPLSPFCRSFKKILGLHSNCWLRGWCGFPRHTRGLGTSKPGWGLSSPRNTARGSVFSPLMPCTLGTHREALDWHLFSLLLTAWPRFGCLQGAELQFHIINALYPPNPHPQAVATLPYLPVLGKVGKLPH